MSADIDFQPLRRADFPLLVRWLADPEVRAWWLTPEATPAAVEAEYGPGVDGTEPTAAFLILLDGEPIGLIQRYRHADHPDWDRAVGVPRAAGVDFLIGDAERRGRGIGAAAIRAFAAQTLLAYPDIDVVVAVPQASNQASCGALAKAGFGLLRVGPIESDDPSDSGPGAVYALGRAAAADLPPTRCGAARIVGGLT